MTYDFDEGRYRQASTPRKEWGAKLFGERTRRGILAIVSAVLKVG